MTAILTAFIGGVFIGAFMGVSLMAACRLAADADRKYLEQIEKEVDHAVN